MSATITATETREYTASTADQIDHADDLQHWYAKHRDALLHLPATADRPAEDVKRVATFVATPYNQVFVHVTAPDIGYPREAIIDPSQLVRYILGAIEHGFGIVDLVDTDTVR